MTLSPITVHPIDSAAVWNAALRGLPNAHILQSWEWGVFKQRSTGWQPIRLAFKRSDQIVGAVYVGLRRVGPLCMLYAPKGPALDAADQPLVAFVLDTLERLARRHLAIWLKIDPDVAVGSGVPGEADDTPNPAGLALLDALRTRGWQFSPDQVQFRNTVLLDLTPTDDQLLAGMSQNTRRKVRVAQRDGVTVRLGTVDDLPLLYDLYRLTAERDGFLIRPTDYYLDEWRMLIEAGMAQPLIAEVNGKAIAHVILLHFAQKCFYFYGASANEERDKMPNYLLQWEAIRWAKAHGYATYDFWGAPDTFVESDRMWGVYQFKRGFRGDVVRYAGAWDYAPYPLLYRAYTELMPHLIALIRRSKTMQ